MRNFHLRSSDSVLFASLLSADLDRRALLAAKRLNNHNSMTPGSLERKFARATLYRIVSWLLLFLGSMAAVDTMLAAPAYVHGYYSCPQTSQATVPVTFAAAQTAGNLNVVVVGWNDTTATLNTVTDKTGNTYQLAVGPLNPEWRAFAGHLLREEHRSSRGEC